MNKFILTVTLFVFAFVNIVAQEPIQLTKINTIEGSSLQFMNQKSFDVSKIDRFTARLESYYQIVNAIEYYVEENVFVIQFNSVDIEDTELRDILSHFNVYEFTIIQQ
jgi:hypothetical protein